MAKCFFFFLHLLLLSCNSVTSSGIPHAKDTHYFEKEELFPSIHRVLIEYFHSKLSEFDSIDPPTTALPSAPLLNPVTAPPVTTAPGIITVPGTTPGGLPPPVPTTTTPATNPVNPPVPVTNPVTTPTTNPVTTPSTQTPTGSGGKSWCIAKNGASQAALQSALDYACGIGGADCATIQQGSSCYEPATLQNHASYAFNSYYQKNPEPTSCDFGGAAAVTTTNPSTGTCVYPSSSASSSSSSPTTPITPTTQAPNNPTSLPTPTTSSPGSTFPGTQSPPPGFSLGNPDPTGLGAFGASPPLVNSASVSVSNKLWPLSVSLVIVASLIMFGQ